VGTVALQNIAQEMERVGPEDAATLGLEILARIDAEFQRVRREIEDYISGV